MSSDPSDVVDRLFACFKCGTSTPQSALREQRILPEKSRKSGAINEDEVSVSSPKEKIASTSLSLKFRNRNQISPIIFYGSPHGAPIKRPSQLLRLLHEIHFDLRENNELLSRKEVWVTFPRQEDAIRFAEKHGQVNIFCYQDHFCGQRRFLVSTYEEFWRRYEVMDAKLRHHYEVIREGFPCHLYFDLEFDKRANTNRNADEMVSILISLTFTTLFDKYSIRGEEEWVIELDSSTEEKFSRHVIIRIPKTAFKDNLHVGAFVSQLYSTAACLQGSDPQLEKLYIRKDLSCPTSKTQLFVDSAVYSRNRCFRLAFSSKAGKSSFLLPTRRFSCSTLDKKKMFMDSLICNIDVQTERLLLCKMDIDCRKVLSFDSEVHKCEPKIARDIPICSNQTHLWNSQFSGQSPFPALDEFIESIASSEISLGKIRSWYWFSGYGLMVYNMLRSRYCERIGREHKSNHVMYIVDFNRAGYYQKCHDPDCRGYRSPLRPVPANVIPDDVALQDSDDPTAIVDNNCTEDIGWWQHVVGVADCIEGACEAVVFSPGGVACSPTFRRASPPITIASPQYAQDGD